MPRFKPSKLNAKPRHRLKLPAFQIGRYPVTNGQYQRFVLATGREWNSPEAGQPERRNHPATGVSWRDALAYCAWLTQMARADGTITQNQEYTLPSEAQWERAAAGPDGLRYPWGEDGLDDHANTHELGLGETSAVGLFPLGRSKPGCLDMAGNVWEWTRSLWGTNIMKPDFIYPYDRQSKERENLTAGDEIYRVVRGGSWSGRRDLARCAVRDWLPPGLRLLNLGFRVVLSSSPVA